MKGRVARAQFTRVSDALIAQLRTPHLAPSHSLSTSTHSAEDLSYSSLISCGEYENCATDLKMITGMIEGERRPKHKI